MQMETRYGQDMKLADSGLTGLELVTEMFGPFPDVLIVVYQNQREIVPITYTIHLLYSTAFPHSLLNAPVSYMVFTLQTVNS
jgi:hypothetical protein